MPDTSITYGRSTSPHLTKSTMRDSLKLLTIAIPTFNRCEELSNCLESIRNAWTPALAGKVELVVSSNASSDGTDDLIRGFQIEGLPLRYERWPENVGPIRNFLRLVELSEAQYCWLLSDDDAIERDGLFDVVRLLDGKPETGGILLKSTPYTPDLSTPLRNCSTEDPPRFEQIPVTNIQEFLHEWGLLSVCVVNVQLWRQHVGSIPLDEAGAYPHVWIQAAMMHAADNWGIIPHPIIRYRTNNDSFLSENGALRRALMPISSYGYLATFYSKSDPVLSNAARGLCCDFVFHYAKEMKKGWGGAEPGDYKTIVEMLRVCWFHEGWRKPANFFRAVFISCIPVGAISLLRKASSRTAAKT